MMSSTSYCMREKSVTPSKDSRIEVSANGKYMKKSTCVSCGGKKSQFVSKKVGESQIGGKIDIHSLIGKLPKPKMGWTPSNYKYMGPYNPLDKQLSYDPNTGEVLDWKVKPYNKVDEVSAHHDICYEMGKNKGECDRKMITDLDKIPYGEMPKWGQVARTAINVKQKLGLGMGNDIKKKKRRKIGMRN